MRFNRWNEAVYDGLLCLRTTNRRNKNGFPQEGRSPILGEGLIDHAKRVRCNMQAQDTRIWGDDTRNMPAASDVGGVSDRLGAMIMSRYV